MTKRSESDEARKVRRADYHLARFQSQEIHSSYIYLMHI